jgi:hypothetical protein
VGVVGMKSLSIASLALVLALSGCSSSPSIEEQTKLVEYEKCLETELEKWLLQGRNEGWSQSTINMLEKAWAEDNINLSDYFIEDCEKYRP